MPAVSTWTPREDALLRKLYAEEVSVSEIAHDLGRSEGGVHKRMEQLGMVKYPKRISKNELMVLVADTFNGEFTESELAIACYKMAPDKFGMRGHQHPDTKTVGVCLAQKSGPVKKGLIVRVRPRVLRLTPLGKMQADKLRG